MFVRDEEQNRSENRKQRRKKKERRKVPNSPRVVRQVPFECRCSSRRTWFIIRERKRW